LLLSAEVALCETLGLSEEDYWYFVDLAERYIAERPAGYELVPDVRAGFVVPIIINLVIGIALTAISALLAPKPQEPKTPPSARTPDVKGQSRFAPQTAFDSVQELAALGTVIPLVFARKGVRVSSSLLWSQMLSLGTGQQLRILAMFSSGELEAAPDFAGYAIGDTLLENYTNAKLALYFKRNGGRITEGSADRYSQGTAIPVTHSDAFSVYWDRSSSFQPYFSGTRTPGTQTQFGIYNTMPNGAVYRVDYELILKPDDAESDLKEDIDIKQNKVYRERFPRFCALISQGGDSTLLRYEINGDMENTGRFQPWGVEDVNSFTESERYATDEAISVGDTYLIGSQLVVGAAVPAEPWVPGQKKFVEFKTLEAGTVDFRGHLDVDPVYANFHISRVAIGTVSNNRECTCTEIGLKSTVYKQITGFPNVNALPNPRTISKYERDNGSYSLGSLTKYIYRLSFFQLQVRPLGSNGTWQTISNGTLFCIRNNTPQPQYNFIRISHPFGQYEFRLLPYHGNCALRFYKDKKVWQLFPGTLQQYGEAGGFTITFAGNQLYLNDGMLCNREWIKGSPPPKPTGKVNSLSSYSSGSIPPTGWQTVETRYNSNATSKNLVYYYVYGDNHEFYWDNKLVGTSGDNPFTTKDGFRYERLNLRYSSSGVEYYEIAKQSYSSITVTFDGQVTATGGSGSGLVLQVRTYSNGVSSWSIVNPGTGFANGETVTIPQANATVTVATDATALATAENLNLYDAISDLNLYSSERSSHDDSPEHEIVYVNEQVEQAAPQYDKLAFAGLRIHSTKEWTSFNSLSAFIKRGCMVERLVEGGRSATNLLPEIAYALLTDPVLGAGNTISASQVDRTRMTLAARFCDANGFTWDGVITEKQNIRQWIFEQAGYCLLDFTILGGQFSLVPSVPYGTDFKISNAGKPEIKALFTDGNIRDLRVTFLSPEERKLFKAVLQWRQDKENGFPQTRVVTVRLSDAEGGSDADPEEQFDMSSFCTTQAHPITFAKYALRTRQMVDHAVQFKTTPQAAMGLAPGDYFRLVSEASHTSRFNNGTIGPDGTITCVGTLPSSATIIYWAPGSTGVLEATLTSSNGRTSQTALWGTVFTIKNTTTTSRTYKVETLSYADDGLVDVSASFAPLTSSGSLAALDWSDSAFKVEVG
jgi:hypothetical protein